DLPQGTTLVIEEVEPEHLGDLKVAGDVYSFAFTFPEDAQDYSGEFQLVMGYNQDQETQQMAIYYYNEANESWDHRGGEINDGVIATTVDHFSTYGVLAASDDIEEEQASAGENKLPETATNIYNWILASAFLLALGAILLFIARKRKHNMLR